MRKDTNGAGDTEENSVVVGLGQTVILEENTRVGINVGVRVLRLNQHLIVDGDVLKLFPSGWKGTGGREAKRTHLGLAVLCKNTWSDLVDLANQLEHWVIWEMSL